MSNTKESLDKILFEERKRIASTWQTPELFFPLIETLRALDYITFMYTQDVKLIHDQEILVEKYRYGWALVFKTFYKDFKLTDNIPLFSGTKDERRWLDNLIQYSGCLELSSLLSDFCKADLMSVESQDNLHFHFKSLAKTPSYELLERLSATEYLNAIEFSTLENNIKIFEQIPAIRKKLETIVEVAHGKFMTYSSTDEFDSFYSELGRLYLKSTQVLDDFDDDDKFGGIPFKKYLAQVEFACRSALMHQDCCMALAAKTSDRIFLRDILTHALRRDKFSKELSEYFNVDQKEILQTISCITINKENYENHLSFPGGNPAPYFQLGPDKLVRSTYGCRNKPVLFLLRELKRKYPKDFFDAVNRREVRFRNQLYELFTQPEILTVKENVIIKTSMNDTDIDAILYDVNTGVLGLVQLKWQDPFSTSVKERFSRITNLIPKSVEWLDKVLAWLNENDSATIFKTLKIPGNNLKLTKVNLFVIARNHVHFTDQKLDDRAAWASWFQVMEAVRLNKHTSELGPIQSFTENLLHTSPQSKIERGESIHVTDYNLTFGKYKVSVENS